MNSAPPVIVKGKEGLRGTAELPAGGTSPGRAGEALLHVEGVGEIRVPVDSLVRQADGTYFVPLTLGEVRAALARPAGAEAGAASTEETRRHSVREERHNDLSDDRAVVPIIEETVRIRKNEVETGRVRVTKTVREREETVNEPALKEEVDVVRVPVNRPLDGPASVRTEGDTIIIPVVEEILVVEKRLMLKEEIRVTRRRTETHNPQTVTLRSEEISIERDDPAGAAGQNKRTGTGLAQAPSSEAGTAR